MKSAENQYSLFIWYQSNPDQLAAFRNWILCLKKKIGYQGYLYVRDGDAETTYMEVFHHVGSAGLEKIEMYAAEQACFHNIKRHCELFALDRKNQ